MDKASLPSSSVLNRGIRTFKPRRSRITKSQQMARDCLSEPVIEFSTGPIQETAQWPPSGSPLYLDIGFGNGASTVSLAERNPDNSYLAVDVHTPGVGDLLSKINDRQLQNVRVMETDSIAVLEHMIRPESLAGIFTLFPDPWPKSRHHKRRIVQPVIIDLVYSRLTHSGFWHIATDWQEYADTIVELFAQPQELTRWSGGSVERPARPITHYEQRALRDGRTVTDFRFHKI